MSDEKLALFISVGILAALALWVPALELLQRAIRHYGRRGQKH